MKHIILTLLVTCLLAVPATAQVNYAVSGGTAYVTNSPNAAGDIVIASTYNGFPVTSIGQNAFYYCTSLTSVTIPNSVANIGWYAFYSCTSLTSLTIGNSVTSIGFEAFKDCISLTNVTIPNSVTSIEWNAFYSCTSLTSVTIGNGVPSIGDQAFWNCTSLASVTIPNSITNIGSGAFSFCFSLTSVSIPNSVTSIGGQAFSSCTSLTSVTIPNSVTSIGEQAFSGCTSLTNISVDTANVVYSSLDGVLFNKAQTTLFQFPGGRGGGYAIPNSVTSIGYAFSGCTSLASVTIPNSVTSIEIWAFISCTSLTNVTIVNSVTSIGYQAFRDCTSLTSVTIPNSVTNIGGYAFEYCTSLTNLTFLGNAPTEGFSMFANVGAGATVYYYNGTTGWGPTYGGLPTVMLAVPAPQLVTGSAGVKPGGFGFTLTGVLNQTIVVEASTNLTNWQSIWTNTLSSGSSYFSDPEWTNHPARFYRLRSS